MSVSPIISPIALIIDDDVSDTPARKLADLLVASIFCCNAATVFCSIAKVFSNILASRSAID